MFKLKQFLKSPWNNPYIFISAWNSKCFSRPSLSICKHTNIETINCTLNKRLRIFKYFFLSSLLAKARIKHKFFKCVLVLLLLRRLNLITLLIKLLFFFNSYSECELVYKGYCVYASHSNFIEIHRSYSAINSYFTFHIFNLIM